MNTTDTTTKGTAPTHYAYQVREGNKQSYWTRVGTAWMHKDGKGFSAQLECIPLDGRVTYRLASEDK